MALGNSRFLTLGSSAAVALCTLLAAGCGGASTPHVASIGTTPDASTTAATPAAKMAAFYRCMAAHGFPNYRMPTLLKTSSPGQAKIKLTPAQARMMRSPGFEAANRDCAPLTAGFGSGLTPAREAAARAQARKFAQCARSQGMPNFPDPNSIGAIDLSAAGIDPESPAFLRAKQACQSLDHGFIFVVQPAG